MPQIFKIENKNSENIMNLIAWVKEKLWIKSVTFDNWMEFAKHYLLKNIWIKTYFCNPYSSWEKWSIENLNKISW
jgi:IS30 family transposase